MISVKTFPFAAKAPEHKKGLANKPYREQCAESLSRQRIIAAYVYGKPKQDIEITSKYGGPLEIAVLAPEDRYQRTAELLTRRAGDA